MFCFLVYKTTSKFMSEKIIIELSKHEHPIEEVPFPAFTICPEVFIAPDNFTFALSDGKFVTNFSPLNELLWIYCSDGVLRFVDELQRRLNYSGDDIIDRLNRTQQQDWLFWIVDGEWPTGWSLPFQMILTQWGFCFSFNLMPLHELLDLGRFGWKLKMKNQSFDSFFFNRIALEVSPDLFFTDSHYSASSSLLNKSIPYSLSSTSLQLIIGLNVNFPQNYFDVHTKPGYHFIIHSTNEFPSAMSTHFYQFIHETGVLVTPEATLVSDDLTLDRRNCYFDREKQLKLFKVYTKQNCEHECQSFFLLERCGCVPFYFLSKIHVRNLSRLSSYIWILRSFKHGDLWSKRLDVRRRCPIASGCRGQQMQMPRALRSCQLQFDNQPAWKVSTFASFYQSLS